MIQQILSYQIIFIIYSVTCWKTILYWILYDTEIKILNQSINQPKRSMYVCSLRRSPLRTLGGSLIWLIAYNVYFSTKLILGDLGNSHYLNMVIIYLRCVANYHI